jgi:hypothetical protein
MIYNVLHNMLRAKNLLSHFPLPRSGSASLHCPFIQQLLFGLALHIGEGHATFRAGLIGGRGGAVGGAWRRSAGLDSRGCSVFRGWILGVPGQHLLRNVRRALQASSSTPSSGAQVLRVRALMLCDAATDAFHVRHCHGLHALPTTILREHVGLEVGDEGLEVGEHPLGRRPSMYRAHAKTKCIRAISKRAIFKYAMPKTQTSNCRRFNVVESPDKSLLNRQISNKLRVILRINAVDSEIGHPVGQSLHQ